MGTKIPESLTSEGEAFRLLAEDLRTATSPETIWEHLRDFQLALRDNGETGNSPLVFIHAGGLHPLIRLLRGIVPSDWKSSQTMYISIDAGKALNTLLDRTVKMAELAAFTEGIPLLVQTLGDAPNPLARAAAVQSLVLLANAEPGHCRTMAEAGVMKELLAFLILEDNSQAWVLAHALVRSGTVVRELKQAICGPQADQAFTALLIFKDSFKRAEGETLAAFGEAAMVDILVATLKHETPFCVTIAAEALDVLGRTPGGQALIEASGALPALVRIIKTQRHPIDLEEEATVFRRSTFKVEVGGEHVAMLYNNSTARAAMTIEKIMSSGSHPARKSVLEAGGVPALLQLLRESTCPATLIFTASAIFWFFPDPESSKYSRELADKLSQSGLCDAVIQALRKQIKGTHSPLLNVLVGFIAELHDHLRARAVAVCVAGGVVEFTVAYLANPGRDGIEYGAQLLQFFIEHPDGRERIRTPGVADQLIEWLVKQLLQPSLLQADWPELSSIFSLLTMLLQECPTFLPAAIKANITPGLVHLLRKVHMRQAKSLDGICTAPNPLELARCLMRLLMYDKINKMDWWKSAVAEGVVPVIIDWLKSAHAPTVVNFVRVSKMLLLNAPTGEVEQWGGELVRAIAGLLTSVPPVAPLEAVKTLSEVCVAHPELVLDCHTSGNLGESLQQLTMHANPNTVAAALQLRTVLSCGNQDPHWTHQPAESQATKHAASTSRPCPIPTPKEQSKAQGPKLATPPSSNTAATMKPPHEKPSSRQELSSGPRARPDEAQLSEVPDPKLHGEGISRGGASPGRRSDKIVRACAGCGITAERVKSGRLQDCGACGSVQYCGKACQTAHWPEHKSTCKRMQATRQ